MELTTGELALISVGATSVGVLAGGGITYAVTNRQIRAAAAEGDKQRAHDAEQRDLERDHETLLRDEQRKGDVFGVFLDYVTEWSGYAGWIRMQLEGTAPFEFDPPRPKTPSDRASGEMIKASLLAGPELSKDMRFLAAIPSLMDSAAVGG